MKRLILATLALTLLSSTASADSGHALHQDGAVKSPADSEKVASLDILVAHVHQKGRVVTFHMTTNGIAGAEKPKPAGKLGGAPAYVYVWPTSLDPLAVGFEGKTGILALAAATHPDFDDTPLIDESGDGNTDNDGGVWHSHWVVLTPTEACGPGALAVRDIPKGEAPKMPATWPGLPIYLDSPGFTPVFDGPEVKINVSFADADVFKNGSYDGVTAALRINKNIHAPLFCVTDVFDVASGNLSLPGKVQAK